MTRRKLRQLLLAALLSVAVVALSMRRQGLRKQVPWQPPRSDAGASAPAGAQLAQPLLSAEQYAEKLKALEMENALLRANAGGAPPGSATLATAAAPALPAQLRGAASAAPHQSGRLSEAVAHQAVEKLTQLHSQMPPPPPPSLPRPPTASPQAQAQPVWSEPPALRRPAPPAVQAEPSSGLDMAMRYCSYTSIPDRYGSDIFAAAKTDPNLLKMFGKAGSCRGGPYGGQYMIDAFSTHGFAPVPQDAARPDNWTMLWTQNSQAMFLSLEHPGITADLRAGRRMHNHCTLILYAGDKCRLAKHMERVRKLPAVAERPNGALGLLQGYLLNEEEGRSRYDELATLKVAQHPEAGFTHMMKPCVASGASGQLFWPPGTKLKDLPNGGRVQAVMQEYVATPLLYEGDVKFHLRLYLLVTSYSPMRLLLCRKGLVLRASHPYSYAGGDEEFDQRMHLTNTKVNAAEPLTLDDLWAYITRVRGEEENAAGRTVAHAADRVWERIKELSAKLLCTQALSREKSTLDPPASGSTACFDVFGLDVILDEKLRPWIMEINEGPDMVIHDKWPAEHEAKSTVFDEVAHWSHNLLASHSLSDSGKRTVLGSALRQSDQAAAKQAADAVAQGTSSAALERWWALYLELMTLKTFDRIYPSLSAPTEPCTRTPRGADCGLTAELCSAALAHPALHPPAEAESKLAQSTEARLESVEAAILEAFEHVK